MPIDKKTLDAMLPESIKKLASSYNNHKIAEAQTGLTNFDFEKIAEYLGGRQAARRVKWATIYQGLQALKDLEETEKEAGLGAIAGRIGQKIRTVGRGLKTGIAGRYGIKGNMNPKDVQQVKGMIQPGPGSSAINPVDVVRDVQKIRRVADPVTAVAGAGMLGGGAYAVHKGLQRREEAGG